MNYVAKKRPSEFLRLTRLGNRPFKRDLALCRRGQALVVLRVLSGYRDIDPLLD
jgi:hypothetical protein